MVGGWSDGYTNAALRLLEHLECPRKGLIGPWEHTWPEEGYPGPAIGFLQESLRFWDHWLKGESNGVMDGPLLRFYRQTSAPPRGGYDIRPGGWAAEPTWPSPRVTAERRYLVPSGLTPEPGDGQQLRHSSPLALGADAGSWLPYGNPADLPADQRAEDAWSLCFDSEPLAGDLDILGQPAAHLRLASDRPVAFVAVRLCDVAAGRNLRADHPRRPQPLPPGGTRQPRAARAGPQLRRRRPLKAISYVVPAGHRLRVALSTSYWPWIWPSPEPVELAVTCDAASYLELPIRAPGDDSEPTPFEEPELSERLAVELLAERNPRWEIARDAVSGEHTVVMSRALWGSRRLPNGIEIPRSRSRALLDRRGRPALGAGRMRALDPHRARRVADAHRGAREHDRRRRGLPRLGNAGRVRGHEAGHRAFTRREDPARPLLTWATRPPMPI